MMNYKEYKNQIITWAEICKNCNDPLSNLQCEYGCTHCFIHCIGHYTRDGKLIFSQKHKKIKERRKKMSIKKLYECSGCSKYFEQINIVHLNDSYQSSIFFCDECIKKHNQVEKKHTKENIINK